MKQKSRMEQGQALVLITLAAVGLFGVVGLAIDGSAKLSDRRHAQNAADTAALAAALVKANTPPEAPCTTADMGSNNTICMNVIDAAWDRAESNGYAEGLSNDIEVYSPPISGAYTGLDSYVQVILTSRINTTFARIVGITETKNTVEAVAFSGEGGPLFGGASLISVDPSPSCSGGNGSGGGSVDVGGNADVNLIGGGIFVNSSATCGYSQTSCGVTLNISGGGSILSAGSNIYIKDKGSGDNCYDSNGDPIPTDNTQRPYSIPDDIYLPDEPAECNQSSSAYPTDGNWSGDNWTIRPGYYNVFPHQAINGGHGGKKVRITMEPGIYCVEGDVNWNGNIFEALDGTSGVTIYIKPGYTFDFRIDSEINLIASGPEAGEFENFLIVVAGNHNSITDCQINGGDYLNMSGMIYAPYCDVTINGNSTSVTEFHAQVLGWDLKVNGNNTINFIYDPNLVPVIKRRVGLMQ